MEIKTLTAEQLVELKKQVDKELERRVRKLAESAGIALKGPRKPRSGRIMDEQKRDLLKTTS